MRERAKTPEGDALLERIAVVFDPSLSLTNGHNVYRITDGLIGRYVTYLESYLQRSATLAKIEQVWKAD